MLLNTSDLPLVIVALSDTSLHSTMATKAAPSSVPAKECILRGDSNERSHRANFTVQRVIYNFPMASDCDSVSGLSLPDISVAFDTTDCGILPQTITP